LMYIRSQPLGSKELISSSAESSDLTTKLPGIFEDFRDESDSKSQAARCEILA